MVLYIYILHIISYPYNLRWYRRWYCVLCCVCVLKIIIVSFIDIFPSLAQVSSKADGSG